MQAARFGHSKAITALIEYGNASLNQKNNDGWTALVVAAYTGQLEAARNY